MAVTTKDAISRRKLLAATVVAAGVGLPRPALLAPLKKVRLVYGGGAIDSSDEGFFSSIPIGAGFYNEEGLEVEVFAVNGSSTAVNLLATGQVQFTNQSNGGLFAGVDRGVPMISFACQVPDNYFALAVLADGPIHSAQQLKGKVIGVPSVGGGTFVMLKATIQHLGWDSSKDVEYLAVGGGLPALDALQRGRVQALFLWSSPYAVFEAVGVKLRYFQPEPLPQAGFSQVTNVSLSVVKDDPGLVSAMARALGKSLVFMATAQPEVLTKLHYHIFPNTRPPGLSDEQVDRADRFRLLKMIGYMRFQQRVFQRTEKLGDIDDRQVETVRDLLFDAGEIKQKLPVDRYFTRQFLGAMNDFDFEAVIAKAKVFQV